MPLVCPLSGIELNSLEYQISKAEFAKRSVIAAACCAKEGVRGGLPFRYSVFKHIQGLRSTLRIAAILGNRRKSMARSSRRRSIRVRPGGKRPGQPSLHDVKWTEDGRLHFSARQRGMQHRRMTVADPDVFDCVDLQRANLQM